MREPRKTRWLVVGLALLAGFGLVTTPAAAAVTSDTYTIVLTSVYTRILLLDQGPLTGSVTKSCVYFAGAKSEGQTIPAAVEVLNSAGEVKSSNTVSITLRSDGVKRSVFSYASSPTPTTCTLYATVTATTCSSKAAWKIEFTNECTFGPR